MYAKKLPWWSSLKKWFTGLYLVALALGFITTGIILLLLPLLKNTVCQTIGGALLATGFSILVATITARQSSFEQYSKEANLQRKTNVYGPLHAELKVLRETFEEARAGRVRYPRWIEILGVERPSSLRYAPTAIFPAFSYWPTFKTDYRIDNFSLDAQKLLNEVQDKAVTYGNAVEDARKAVHGMLRPHIADSITKEEQSPKYQAWLSKRTSNTPENNRWLDFIYQQTTAISPTIPLGESLSYIWSVKIGWLLADKPAQAASEIFYGDAMNWDASQYSSLSWFQDIFEAAIRELKNDQTYQKAQNAQQELFTTLLEVEKLLYQALRYIRDHYEGGSPLV